MQKLFSFDSQKDHYTADACIVWCFDDRFSSLYDRFIKEKQFSHVDLVKVAGGAKDIASPDDPSRRAYLLDQIAKSIKLHHANLVVLMAHDECGAYGGASDLEFYASELRKAKEEVARVFPGVVVEAHVAHFDGMSAIA